MITSFSSYLEPRGGKPPPENGGSSKESEFTILFDPVSVQSFELWGTISRAQVDELPVIPPVPGGGLPQVPLTLTARSLCNRLCRIFLFFLDIFSFTRRSFSRPVVVSPSFLSSTHPVSPKPLSLGLGLQRKNNVSFKAVIWGFVLSVAAALTPNFYNGLLLKKLNCSRYACSS